MGAPFECDMCQFRNVYDRTPDFGSRTDRYALLVIRRVLLDVMWSRETSTVEGNLSRARLDYDSTQAAFDFPSPVPILGRDEVGDVCGMRVAMQTLHVSLRKGKYDKTLQIDTVRGTRTWNNNAHRAGEGAFNQGSTLASNYRGVMYVTEGPVHTEWFHRFEEGYKRRMGIIKKQNEALMVHQLLVIAIIAEEDWSSTTDEDTKRDIENVMAFVIIGFMVTLRGEEVPLARIEGIARTWREDYNYRVPFIMITLRGRFKREKYERFHCLPIADQGKSKVPSRKWIGRLMARRCHVDGDERGWLFLNKKGKRAKISDYDELFKSYVKRAHAKAPREFASGTKLDQYSLRRSLRRGSTTTAGNNQVPKPVVDRINRWRKDNRDGGDPMAGLTMFEVYTEVKNSIDSALRYSLSH